MSLNLIPPIVVFNNVDISTDQESNPIHVQYSDNISVQFVWSGDPVGTFGISVSNTATLASTGYISGGTWTPLTLIGPDHPDTIGESGDGVIDLNQLGVSFIKVTYAATSGSGRCTATLTAKPV